MINKITVVGCGYWGKNLVRNFAEIGALHSVCDDHAPLALQMSETYKVPVVSFNEALENPDIKGVAIAAPAAQHFQLTKAALQKGKDVFVEKPLALNLKDGEELCAIAKEHNAVLMVGHLLQYHPAYIKLKQMVQAGDLGELKYIYSNRMSLGKIRREEDVVWSFAPHDISMILGLIEEAPQSVTISKTHILNDKIADNALLHLSFANDVKAHVQVSWMNPFKEQKLVVIGDKAMAVFDDTLPLPQKLCLYRHKIDTTGPQITTQKDDGTNIDIGTSEPLRNECEHFLECMTTRATPRTDGAEGLRVLKVLEEASR